ncbi:hypothetical protein BDA96_10G110600 [Sorghum bicolor]|jgi:hypothetical protein|uniref:Uncharacterized protein n=2 Tax=Sorghum bicolor TaxID=4558 RepID=A0A921Q0Y6_SORBI|nr:uncharacterized protein LOC8065509 [Sorghum bicolor]EER89457.1 hypothetical protein SORBI_3010G090700 [Sorghum bicolor]KAG0513528.1 hypothetical protein BDA96_10G110600 [Sorghum bicolor]|eukprot:XP_002438090.1 uncharacterized protein LOC8065509 [Sorghum bicolor]
MLLLSADSPLGLQTLISADADASSKGGGNVATRTIAASPSVVRCLANGCEADGGRDGKEEEEERGGGCWVSYGWRRLPRRLPPAIQSPRPLVRERTADGRLVISREEAAHRVCARKVEDRRLVLELVDDGRDGGAAPPSQRRRRWSHPLVGQEAKASASAAGEESARAPTTSSPVAAVPVPPVPAEACFEGAIREASLRETRMSLLRMVH